MESQIGAARDAGERMQLWERLATLLGWKELHPYKSDLRLEKVDSLEGTDPADEYRRDVPDWTNDYNACAQLLATLLSEEVGRVRIETIRSPRRGYQLELRAGYVRMGEITVDKWYYGVDCEALVRLAIAILTRRLTKE